MVKSWIPISLLLLNLCAHAETQRREPSLFLEYERELKRSNEAAKQGEAAFQNLMAPIVAAKPAASVLPAVKTLAIAEPLPPKPIHPDKDAIGADHAPFLVVTKPSPAGSDALCPDPKSDSSQNGSKSIFKNLNSAKEKVLAKAKEFLGTPYGFGDEGKERTDCSGLTQLVYQQFGISLPHSAAEQAQLGEPVDLKDLEVGDLLFYRTYKTDPSHVAIYAGDGQIIHASFTAHKVQYDSIDKSYYKNHFLYAKRLAFNNDETKKQ